MLPWSQPVPRDEIEQRHLAHVRAVKPFWALSLCHARWVRDDDDRARRAASLFNRPVMRAFRRAASSMNGRETGYGRNSPELLLKQLQRPGAHGVLLDSGRSGEIAANGWLQLGLGYEPDADMLAPMSSYFTFPYVADEREAVLDVFCELAETLEAAYGAASVEPSFNSGQNAAMITRPAAEDLPTYTVMTPDRIRYRRTPGFLANQIHRGIGGPDWGTFLGPGHLARLPPDTLKSSAFYQVRPLAHGGAFIRLSDDPLVAHTDAILGLVDRARAALDPIVIHDLSDVRL